MNYNWLPLFVLLFIMPPKITRSISVDSFAPKLTSLFRKRSRKTFEDHETPAGSEVETNNSDESHDEGGEYEEEEEEEEEGEDGKNSASETSPVSSLPVRKKRKIAKTKKQLEFEKKEAEYDEELPEEYRIFRPKGFRFNIPATDRPIRIYADGVFDLFHLGHMKQLEQAKKAFANVELVCGVPSDIETHKRKGLTVLTDQQRVDTLKHCRWVDEVIPNAPWCVTTDFLLEHKIDYVAHDDLPYASSDSDDIYKPIKEMGMFLTTQRTEGISTSDIITKIIRDYDKYLMRNFARGATRKELNVSWLKKNELEFKKHINDFRSYWKKNQTNLNNVSRDLYFEVREYMRGRKFDMQSFLDNTSTFSRGSGAASSNASNSLSTASLNEMSNVNSPLTDFALKYIGNENKELNRNNPKKTLFDNVKGWMLRDDSHDEYSTNDEKDTLQPSLIKEQIKEAVKDDANDNISISSTTSPKRMKKIPNKKTKKSA